MPQQPNKVPDFIPDDQHSDFIPDESYTIASPTEVSGAYAYRKPDAAPPPSGALDRFLAPKYLDQSAGDPNTLKGYGQHAAEALRGMGQGAKSLVATPLPGMEGNPVIWNPVTQIKKDIQGVKDWNELRGRDPDYAWGNILGPMLLTHTIAKVAPHMLPASMADKLAAGANAPVADAEAVANDLRAARGIPNLKTGRVVGTPNTVQDLLDLASTAQSKLDTEWDYALAKNGHLRTNLPDVNGNFPLAEKIRALKSKYSDENQWGRDARAAIDKRAAEYEHPIALDKMDLERKNANSRIDAFEAASQIKQASKRIASPDIASDEVIANWVRDNVYPDVDKLEGKPPGYFRDLKSRVGSLMRIQSNAEAEAERVANASAKGRGTEFLEKLRPGMSVSPELRPHGWLGNLKEAVAPSDAEASANTAVSKAFSPVRKVLAPSRATRQAIKGADLPLSALIGGETGVDERTNRLMDFLRQNPQQ